LIIILIYEYTHQIIIISSKMHKSKEYIHDIYNLIVSDHSIEVIPSNEMIMTFLDGIINRISLIKEEKKPDIINIIDLSQSIINEFPKTNEKNVKPIQQDSFYKYIAEYLVTKSSTDPFYETMASVISMIRVHQITSDSQMTVADLLYNNYDTNNLINPLISDEVYEVIVNNHLELQRAIDFKKDFDFDYFGIKTLEQSYLFKRHDAKYLIIERPQHMMMRVAIGIHMNDIQKVIETYNILSDRMMTHATPTLFNAGTIRPQMSSCFLQSIEDSLEDIFETIADVANISKWAGGIGIHMSSIRARGSLIRKTNGASDGIIPLCSVLNKVARYMNQGGKRKGSIACYLEPYHADIFEFCELRLNTGTDDNRARDLYLALWVPSLFIERVRNDGRWSLMCPDECPGLNTTHSHEFNRLYEKYENEGKYKKQIKARELWKHILTVQTETGFPYILYKDNANNRSNQQNLGTIRSSNLCAEIIEYSDKNETAVCNLASLCLPRFIKNYEGLKIFDHEKLIEICRVAVRNLNRIIDLNFYPTKKTKLSNMRHRPIGIGVQGLADVYNMMGYPFDSKEASDLNKRIFETIYYATLYESNKLAQENGAYSSFNGSPFSQGRLQFHLWGIDEKQLLMGYPWKHLVENIKKYGTRNSLLTAVMPTASTSQIMGNSECIEPYMSNIFTRSTLAGNFIVVNRNLMKDLIERGLWNDMMKKMIIIENGSVQGIDSIPEDLKAIYKTAFEISQKVIIKQSADRGIFIDQSQSLNVFMKEPNFDILNSILIDGHDLGLKTGMYYYRTLPAVNPINFGIDINEIKKLKNQESITDMISGMYRFNNQSNGHSDKKQPIEIPENEKICEWRPGMKLDDCMVCSS